MQKPDHEGGCCKAVSIMQKPDHEGGCCKAVSIMQRPDREGGCCNSVSNKVVSEDGADRETERTSILNSRANRRRKVAPRPAAAHANARAAHPAPREPHRDE